MSLRKAQGGLIFALLVLGLDQGSKWLVLSTMVPGEVRYVAPFWNWVLVFNTGAAFSFLSEAGGWQRWFFTGLAFCISAWIVRLLWQGQNRTLTIALAAILGGALGNVFDRLRLGRVVDFIQWHAAGYAWPAFNIADAAIVLGAVLMFWDSFFSRPKPTPDHTKK